MPMAKNSLGHHQFLCYLLKLSDPNSIRVTASMVYFIDSFWTYYSLLLKRHKNIINGKWLRSEDLPCMLTLFYDIGKKEKVLKTLNRPSIDEI